MPRRNACPSRCDHRTAFGHERSVEPAIGVLRPRERRSSTRTPRLLAERTAGIRRPCGGRTWRASVPPRHLRSALVRKRRLAVGRHGRELSRRERRGRSDLRCRHHHRRPPGVSARARASPLPGALAQGVSDRRAARVRGDSGYGAIRRRPRCASLPVNRCVSVALARDRRRQRTRASVFSTSAILTLPMNAHSGRPELAPYPDWTAQTPRPPEPFAARVSAAPRRAGRQLGRARRNADGSMPSIDEPGYGRYWLDPRWRDPGNLSSGFTGPRGHLEHRAEPGDLAHQPSLCVRAVSRDRRSVLRGRNRVLGQLLPHRLVRVGGQPERAAGAPHRQRSSRHRVGPAQPRRCRGVPARQPSDEGVSRVEGVGQPHLSRSVRQPPMCPGPCKHCFPASGRKIAIQPFSRTCGSLCGNRRTSRGPSIA